MKISGSVLTAVLCLQDNWVRASPKPPLLLNIYSEYWSGFINSSETNRVGDHADLSPLPKEPTIEMLVAKEINTHLGRNRTSLSPVIRITHWNNTDETT